MRTYIVFGDPRRVENNITYKIDIPDASVTVRDGHAIITHAGRKLSGAVLSYVPADSAEQDQDPHLSVIISDGAPFDETVLPSLQMEGWEPSGPAPRGVTVPVLAAATLLLSTASGVKAFYTSLWIDRAFVPTQRHVFHTPEGPTFLASVLAMEAESGEQPALLLAANDSDIETTVDGVPVGWMTLHGVMPPNQWESLLRVSAAIEAEVGYLLSTPIVTGVDILDIDRLRPEDITDLLPSDVVEELTASLTALGREDLLPKDE